MQGRVLALQGCHTKFSAHFGVAMSKPYLISFCIFVQMTLNRNAVVTLIMIYILKSMWENTEWQ